MLLVILVLVLIVVLVIVFSGGSKRPGSNKDSRYSKTGNWMDFDPGVDSNKVGDPKYPNAGPDSVMKHEFMEDLSKGDK